MTVFGTLRRVIFAAALVPAAALVYGAFTDDLSANPIDYITDTTGTTALTFLIITLTITPLRRLTGRNEIIRLRRMLGLFAFFYGSLHFATYIWLDQFFDLPEIVKDVIKRPFITVGFASFVLLIPLALTSNRAMIIFLGKQWQRLHRAVYLATIGGVIHFLWLVKADNGEPLLYGLILTVLLGYRLVEGLGSKTAGGLRSRVGSLVRNQN